MQILVSVDVLFCINQINTQGNILIKTIDVWRKNDDFFPLCFEFYWRGKFWFGRQSCTFSLIGHRNSCGSMQVSFRSVNANFCQPNFCHRTGELSSVLFHGQHCEKFKSEFKCIKSIHTFDLLCIMSSNVSEVKTKIGRATQTKPKTRAKKTRYNNSFHRTETFQSVKCVAWK